MSSIHTPERLMGESQEQYRERQAMSRLANKRLIEGANERAVTERTKRESKRAKHRAEVAARIPAPKPPKKVKVRKHKPTQPHGPTWPATKDQRAQSRPVHNLNPNRERDAGKREKPKSAVAKRMDRPERVALIDRGHAKLMRFFGAV